MLRLEDFVKIRELHFKDGWGIKQIARTFHYARGTVRKAIREANLQGRRYTQSNPRPRPATTPEVREYVEAILKADKTAPRKQRHTARKIMKRLGAEKPQWSIGESTLRGLVRQIRAELRERPPVTIPLSFDPGEEAQADFGEAYVDLAGERVKCHVLVITLCYSRRTFAMAFPSPNQEAFLEGHVRAFRHFGGLTGRIAYDNPKVAVIKILRGGAREENKIFTAFRSHYCFEPRYCSPGIEGAHEKGRVERRIQSYRLDALVPVPAVDSWAHLNDMLLAKCLELDAVPHPEQRHRSVSEVFRDEAQELQRLPQHDFVCADSTAVRVDGNGRVVYNNVYYSVPCEYGRRQVEVRAFWDRVDVYDATTLIARWPRSYEAGKEHYDYHHYLKLRRYTPGAALNGRPFRELPEVLLRYRKELLARHDRRIAGRHYAKVLSLLLEHDEKLVLDAVELAMLCGTFDSAAVETLIQQFVHGPRRPAGRLDLSSRPSLTRLQVRATNLHDYDQLMGANTA